MTDPPRKNELNRRATEIVHEDKIIEDANHPIVVFAQEHNYSCGGYWIGIQYSDGSSVNMSKNRVLTKEQAIKAMSYYTDLLAIEWKDQFGNLIEKMTNS